MKIKFNFLKEKKKELLFTKMCFVSQKRKMMMMRFDEMVKNKADESAQNHILNYFFGPLPEYNSTPIQSVPSKWYKQDLREDVYIKNTYGEYVLKALEGKLDQWQQSTKGIKKKKSVGIKKKFINNQIFFLFLFFFFVRITHFDCSFGSVHEKHF